MSYYLKEGESLFPVEQNAFDVRNALPVGTYTVAMHPMRGFYLKPITGYEINGKIYGDTSFRADRILNTFKSRPHTTGVLLNGEKGSGKTLLAKIVSQKAHEQGISTIVINTPYCGDAFNTFIQNIDEPCVILYDEFEKVFDNEQQEATLTLLDGVYPTKKLFLLTVNDKYKVNQHMRNRPGRIFYMLDFGGLDAEFIKEYCTDQLNNKAHIPTMQRLTNVFEMFNFDMLKALVEEMNRYDESPVESLKMLNAKPFEYSGERRFDVKVMYNKVELSAEDIYPNVVRGNPLASDDLNFTLTIRNPKADKTTIANPDEDSSEDDSERVYIEFVQNDLKKIDADAGTYIYAKDEGTPRHVVVVFSRQQAKMPVNWMDAF